MVVPAGDPGDQLGLRRDVRLADIEQDEDGLLGQEAKSADRLLVVAGQLEVADRRPSTRPAWSRTRIASSRSLASRSAWDP